MKRFAYRLALCVATVSLFAACGGDSGGTTDTTTPSDVVTDNGTPGDATTDNTTPGDTFTPEDNTTPPTDNACVPQCTGKECGPDGCGSICGLCGPNLVCNAAGACEAAVVGTVPFGGACEVTASCAPLEPEEYISGDAVNSGLWNTYSQCLDSQCQDANGQCSIIYGTPACIKQCGSANGMTAADDAIQNYSGQPQPDGIEDSKNLCAGADPDGPYGDEWRCVQYLNPTVDGQSYTSCVAGTDFKPCVKDSDCSNDNESCQTQQILGTIQTVCMTKIKDGKGVSEFCESNPFNPAVAYNSDEAFCASGSCYMLGIGCSEFCDGDADLCLTDNASCGTDGFCTANSDVACTADSDCSAWECSADFTISQGPPEVARDMCWPKICDEDSACNDPNFFCRILVDGNGYSDEPGGATQPEEAGLEPLCLRKPENPAALGEACVNDPAKTPGKVCQNPIWCMSGQCSTMCSDDTDCSETNQICAAYELTLDLDSDDLLSGKDTSIPIGICWNNSGSATECTTPSDCTEAGEACAPVQLAAADPADGYEIKFHCNSQASPGSTGAHGDQCGWDSGVDCLNGNCLTLFGDGTDESPYMGVCLDTCREAADCPQGVAFLGGLAPSYNATCMSIRWSWNATADPRDNLYLPVCFPEGMDASMADCSTADPGVANPAACTSATEVCRGRAIATNPSEPANVEFLCLTKYTPTPNADGSIPPYKSLGQSCTADEECDTNMCVNDVAGGGLCSTLCDPFETDPCTAVPGTSCQKDILISRVDPALAAFAYTCKKADATCVTCTQHSDCGDGYVCSNVGGTNYACVEDCSASACTDGGSTCGAVQDWFAVGAQGCSTSCN